MKKFFLILAVLAISSSQVFAEEAVSKNIKAYKGGEGIQVFVVSLLPKTKKQVLIEIKGSDGPLDNLVLLYDEIDNSQGKAYAMELEGVQSTRLRIDPREYTMLYLPGVRDGIGIGYDEKLTKSTSGDAMYRRYLEGEKKGVQKKLAFFDRNKAIKVENDNFIGLQKDTATACGKPISLEVDWKSIDDDKLKRLSINAYCGEALQQISSFCQKNDKSKTSMQQHIDKVHCKFGDKAKASIEQKTLQWITEEQTANQGDFIKYFLENTL